VSVISIAPGKKSARLGLDGSPCSSECHPIAVVRLMNSRVGFRFPSGGSTSFAGVAF
jgi:hypothetical protein